jgi:hypothetical protein
MATSKRKGPGESANSTGAIRRNSNHIITEILGTLLAALIFAATVLTSAFGMSGGFDHAEAGLILAGVVIDGR